MTLTKLIPVFLCIVFPHLSNAQGWTLDAEVEAALNEFNRIRSVLGLDSVTLSEELSKGCYNHARYLSLNSSHPEVQGLGAHEENPELEGYSENGQVAGKRSVIAFEAPSTAVAAWDATFYHRIPLLQPGLKTIGIGWFKADDEPWPVSLIDCISGTEGRPNRDYVCAPRNGQTGVPTHMGAEIPHPVGRQGSYGYPITIYFTKYQKITEVKFQLLDSRGGAVPCYLSEPNAPATDFTQWNTICAIPKEPLDPGKVYTIKVRCMVDDLRFNKTIKFKTQSASE